jgi:hypothetical protein
MAGDSSVQPDTSKLQYRIWRATPDSEAMVAVSDSAAYLIGNSDTFVCADNTGVAINSSSISFNTTSENIGHAGFFIEENDFFNMMPSTIITPVPQRLPFPPLGFVSVILQDLPVFLAALI